MLSDKEIHKIFQDTIVIAHKICQYEVKNKGYSSTYTGLMLARIIDGAYTCDTLLSMGQLTYLPVIMRTMIEALATALNIVKNDCFINKYINYSNNKSRKLFQNLLSSKYCTQVQKDLTSVYSKKLKDESLKINIVNEDMRPSEILKDVDDPSIAAAYEFFVLHSHNNLNELISLYFNKDHPSAVFTIPGSNNELTFYSNAHLVMLILYLGVKAFIKASGVTPYDEFVKLEKMVVETIRS
jgi:hypothetical protein